MYEMSKMTLEQEEVRNQEYNEYVEQMTPKHNLWANMGKAFLLGGGICLLGQIILQIAAGVFGLKAEDAALWCSLLLVLLSVILTSCNVYGILANWGGAGALDSDYRICKWRVCFCGGIPERGTGIWYRMPDF